MSWLFATLNLGQKGNLPSDRVINPKKDNAHCMAVITRSRKVLDDEVVDVDEFPNNVVDIEKSKVKRKRV